MSASCVCDRGSEPAGVNHPLTVPAHPRHYLLGTSAADFHRMENVNIKIPMVEVTAPDGSKSLWVAALAQDAAVAAVQLVIPASHVATLSSRRLTLSPRHGLLPGEVRKVKL